MKIRLVRQYSTYLPDAIVECEDERARQLIRDGIAVRDQPEIESATIDPAVERADLTPRRRRRAVSEPDATDTPGG